MPESAIGAMCLESADDVHVPPVLVGDLMWCFGCSGDVMVIACGALVSLCRVVPVPPPWFSGMGARCGNPWLVSDSGTADVAWAMNE